MNKDQVLRFLEEFLSQFICHGSLISELLACIGASGIEGKVFTLLGARLRLLSCENITTVLKHKEFESIGDGLYSMHLAGSGFNIRILYCFLPNSQPVLLLAFHEKAGKRKTDYSSHISVAVSRKKEMEAQFEHDKERYGKAPFRS